MIAKKCLPALLLRCQWLAIPLLIVFLAEGALRKVEEANPLWYGRAEAIAKRQRIDFAFIGSSKVAAAFVESDFNEEMAARLKRRVVSVNLGRGFSSPHLHYFGLRNLLARQPRSLRGITLFVEAQADAPLYQYHKNWKASWVNRQPRLLVHLLRWHDLTPFWRSRGTLVKDKVLVTAEFLLSRSRIISRRDRARHEFAAQGRKLFARIGRWLLRQPAPAAKPEPLLQEMGGIATDPLTLASARKTGLRYYRSLAASRRPLLRNWERSVLADIVRLVQGHGGQVCFVNLPAFSLERGAYANPEHQANQRRFRQQLGAWNAALLTPDFSYSDEDLPDCFHLRRSRAGEFTRRLAREYWRQRKSRALRRVPLSAGLRIFGDLAGRREMDACSGRLQPPRIPPAAPGLQQLQSRCIHEKIQPGQALRLRRQRMPLYKPLARKRVMPA